MEATLRAAFKGRTEKALIEKTQLCLEAFPYWNKHFQERLSVFWRVKQKVPVWEEDGQSHGSPRKCFASSIYFISGLPSDSPDP